jgi:pimeloyl-ACP methyl ester carboxylesterase
VGGIGSSSTNAGIDQLETGALGYAPGDVLRASYAGGRIPGEVSADLLGVGATPYATLDTQGDLRAAGHHLADLLATLARHAPGVPIDVYAHSQGGVVARLAIARPDLPAEVQRVVTIATPHQGAEAASFAQVARGKPGVDLALDDVGVVHGIDPQGIALEQLAERSQLLGDLGAPPPSVEVLSVAARGDLVVPPPSSQLAGAVSVTVPTAGIAAHDDVVHAAETTRAIQLALADLPPACESATDAVLDSIAGSAIAGAWSAISGVAEVPRVPRALRGSDPP